MNWQQLDDAIKHVAESISAKPDVIVAVMRGGAVPARLLAKHLDVTEMYALTIKKQAETRLITTTITENLADKTVLLVEDVLESGQSMIAAKTYLETIGASVITLSLYYQHQTQITPDYSAGAIDQVPIFPWD
jgi:hypoxanthine phosphoribosyltransferase